MPCGHMGTPIGAPISNIFARFHFVISFFMRAPSGPLIPEGDMGTLWAPIFKKNYALQDSNLHFDVMNIKFYLLSQEFAAGDTLLVGGGWDRVGGACGGRGLG